MDHTKIVPLFPLAVVQFPVALTALHIFEPRYQQMHADVMAGDRIFGIVLRQVDGLAPVGCLVEIVLTKSLPEGRFNILAVGLSRFRLIRVIDDGEKPYAQAEVETFEDDPRFDELEELGERVRVLFQRLIAVSRQPGGQDAGKEDAETPDIPDSDELLSYVVAAYLEVDLTRRQRWLEMTDTGLRLREIEAQLIDLVGEEERRVRIHQLSRTNGHGGHHRDS